MRHAASELQRNRALLPSRSEALIATKNQVLKLAELACRQNDLKLAINNKNPSTLKLLRFRWANKKAILEGIEKQWQWVINQERQGLPPLGMPTSLRLDSNAPFSEFGIYSDYTSGTKNRDIETRELVFITAMATRAFALDKGRNPRDLKELIPIYLTRAEFDPYNPTQPLVYSPYPKSYTAFQIGKPTFTLPLPKNALTVAYSYAGHDSPNGKTFYETTALDDGLIVTYSSRSPAGYLINSRHTKVPFILYSVGKNGRNNGGFHVTIDAFKKSISNVSGNSSTNDDVLARAEFFRPE